MQRLTSWRTPQWADHFSAVEQMLGGLDESAQPSASSEIVSTESRLLGPS